MSAVSYNSKKKLPALVTFCYVERKIKVFLQMFDLKMIKYMIQAFLIHFESEDKMYLGLQKYVFT